MRAVYPVFHVSQLEPATLSTIPGQVQSPLPLIEVNGKSEYEIVEILDFKVDRHWKYKLLYLFQWARYEGTDEETSWILATKLGNAQKLIADVHSTYSNKPGPHNT